MRPSSCIERERLQPLQRDPRRAVVADPVIEHADDVRVIQALERATLAHEPRHDLRPARPVGVEDLQRDALSRIDVDGLEDICCSPRPDRRTDSVGAHDVRVVIVDRQHLDVSITPLVSARRQA